MRLQHEQNEQEHLLSILRSIKKLSLEASEVPSEDGVRLAEILVRLMPPEEPWDSLDAEFSCWKKNVLIEDWDFESWCWWPLGDEQSIEAASECFLHEIDELINVKRLDEPWWDEVDREAAWEGALEKGIDPELLEDWPRPSAEDVMTKFLQAWRTRVDQLLYPPPQGQRS